MTLEPEPGHNKPDAVHGCYSCPTLSQTTINNNDILRRPCTLGPKSIISHTFAGNFREFMGTHAGTSGLSGSTFPSNRLHSKFLPFPICPSIIIGCLIFFFFILDVPVNQNDSLHAPK